MLFPLPCHHPALPSPGTSCDRLRSWLLLLLFPQSRETDTRHLDNLESDTGNITLGLAFATETSEEDFIVLIDEVQATVVWHC